jgi:hypothetical protein
LRGYKKVCDLERFNRCFHQKVLSTFYMVLERYKETLKRNTKIKASIILVEYETITLISSCKGLCHEMALKKGILTIYAPKIYTAPYVRFLLRADTLRGEVGGGAGNLEFCGPL